MSAPLEAMERQNPWWKAGAIPPALDQPVVRTAGLLAYQHLTSASRRQLLIVGPRQVGKTTVLLQIVRRLLREAPSTAICYLRLDDPDLADEKLGKLIDLYRRSIWSPDRLAYLLLDEIHASPGWSKQLKSWVDGDVPNRVLATGSVAAEIADGSRESGPGRWNELHMGPLDFFEYALIRGRARGEDATPVEERWWEKPPAATAAPQRELWDAYLLQGGFPASALDNDLFSAHQKLRDDIYERVLIRDMAVHFGLRSFDTLRHLFRYIAEESSGIANYSGLASRIGSPATTVMDMLLRLRETFLVGQTLPHTHRKEMLRPRPKVYLCDASLRSAVLLHGATHLEDPAVVGKTWETAAHAHLAKLARTHGGELRYWRDARGEVDFVLTLPGRPALPIEVTSGPSTEGKLLNLARCAADLRVDKVLLLDAGEPAGEIDFRGLGVIRWPLPAFLWTLGTSEWSRASREAAHG